MTPDDIFAALHAVVLLPSDLAVARARQALEAADDWALRESLPWDVTEAVRAARLAIDAYELATTDATTARAKTPAFPRTPEPLIVRPA